MTKAKRSLKRFPPYKLKPVDWLEIEWANIPTCAKMRFFRIECWLRSAAVRAQYESQRKKDQPIGTEGSIGEIPLQWLPYYMGGGHHDLLRLPLPDGLYNFSDELAKRPWLLTHEVAYLRREWGTEIIEEIIHSAKRTYEKDPAAPIFVRLNPPFHLKAIQKIQAMVDARRKQLRSRGKYTPEIESEMSRGSGRGYSWGIWASRLKIWDLVTDCGCRLPREDGNRPRFFEDIGRQCVTPGNFPGPEDYREHARINYRRACSMIAAAEKGDWPPKIT